ncbi:hypothetical protein OIE75_29595 [Streptomyces sp. NBC_01723]|uniref:hypothetical protein n=1 Tax=Streptomyces sp. NBC_01723 TaxID=2975921 RepID=UPI002E2F84B7|nr:hypothetical protein [Streptomyces sp. NBC_01723]
MTAAPVEKQVNGHARPPMPVLGEWQALTADPAEEQSSPQPDPGADQDIARAKAWAEAEERRLAAEARREAELKLADAEADAIRVKAEEDARKQRLANDRAERKAAEEQAASEARIAEHNRRRDEADRSRERAAREDQEQQQAEVAKAGDIEKSSTRWRRVAKGFYALCAAVALPVQMTAFYKPDAEYLLVAPVFIEVIALVALVGAAAAVTAGRPHWHYRLVAWIGALTAASINIVHGLAEYDPATAFGTALASIAGPGMWDLHEHGRIRKRDGKPSWRQRRKQRKAEKEEAAAKIEAELRETERLAYFEKAERDAAQRLDQIRADEFPEVHRHAWRLAADLGKTDMTEAIWRQAKLDVEGAPPGESAEVLRMRNAAEMRVEAARQKRPVNGSSQQVASQVLGPKQRRVYNPPARPGRRTKGDTPKQSAGARRQASIAAKNARQKDAS